jgi:DNA-binding LytR/AlgR family response regulator
MAVNLLAPFFGFYKNISYSIVNVGFALYFFFLVCHILRRDATRYASTDSIDLLEKKKESIESIAVKTGKKLHIIPITEIICLQAYGDYVNIMTLHKTHLKEQTLKYFEEHLPDEQFLRVHRSYIVNIHAIQAIERYGREQYLLILSNKEKVKATPEGYRRLRGILNL